MSRNLVISKSCLIEKNRAILNGTIVFDAPGMDASGFLTALYKNTGASYPRFYKMDNLCKLGFLAGELMFGNPAVIKQYNTDEIAIVLYNANASLDTDIRYYSSVKEMASPALFVYTLPNILIGELCIRHGIKGESVFFLAEELNATDLKEYVSLLLEQDIAKACLCGWVDFLGNDYKLCLMWVEKDKQGEVFSVDTINTLYKQRNG